MSEMSSAVYETTSPQFKRRFMIRLWACMIGGTVLDGYILGVIGPVTETLRVDLGLDSLQIGLLVASTMVGIFIGAPVAGWATDRFGRKPMFITTILIFVIASLLQFFVGSPESLIAIRFVMGLAIGAEYSVSWPMCTEFAPNAVRGRLLAMANGVFFVGFTLGYTLAYFAIEAGYSWNLILGSSSVLAIILFLGRLGLPESPRWLWSKGRTEEATAIAYKYLDGAAEVADFTREADLAQPRARFSELFSRQYVRATLFISIFWFCSVLPYFGIATFAEDVLKQFGLSGGLAGGVGLSFVSVAGVVVLVLFIDRLGRRVFTVPPMWLMLAIFLIIGFWSDAPAPVVLALFLIFSFLSGVTGPMVAVYPGELFPTSLRGIGTGFAAAFSRLGAALGTFLMPIAIDSIGISGVILILAGIVGIGAIVSQLWAPETNGKDLSETSSGLIRLPKTGGGAPRG